MNYNDYSVLPENYIRQKINEFLSEDSPDGDKTSIGTIPINKIITAKIISQDNLVFAGIDIIRIAFENFDTKVFVKDGEKITKDILIAQINGNASEILLKERIVLNLIQRLSGIATLTSRFVEIASPYNVKILDTRKTTPGLRLFEKFAVVCGGGNNHRLNLSDGILIKDNHIAAAGSIESAISRIKAMNFNLPIETEVENKDQIIEAVNAGTDGLLLDNMSPEEVKESVNLVRSLAGGSIFIEASGGININTLSNYVKTGIDAVSIGALTHSVISAELHMEFEND